MNPLHRGKSQFLPPKQKIFGTPVNPTNSHSFGPRGKISCTYTLTQWAKQPEVQETWAKISKQHNLVQSPFENDYDIERIFGFADGFLLTPWPNVLR